jgi:hypothetical protein
MFVLRAPFHWKPPGAVEYEWTPSTGLSCDDCPDPDCTVNDFTVYTVTGY